MAKAKATPTKGYLVEIKLEGGEIIEREEEGNIQSIRARRMGYGVNVNNKRRIVESVKFLEEIY